MEDNLPPAGTFLTTRSGERNRFGWLQVFEFDLAFVAQRRVDLANELVVLQDNAMSTAQSRLDANKGNRCGRCVEGYT